MTVSSLLTARGEWAGQPLDPEEIEEMVTFLEERLAEVKAGKYRGLLFAGVDAGGPGSNFYTMVKCMTGCSRLSLAGAAHILSHNTATYLAEE